MNNLSKLAIGVVAIAFLFMLILSTLTVRIAPGEYGVKQNLLGGGVIEKDYTTGLGLRIPFVHSWHYIDRRTHFVTFAENDRDTTQGQSRPALEIRTKDNNLATYDLSVTYHVIPDQAHKLVMNGQKQIYRDRVVTTLESVMREELAQLSSEEIFSTDARIRVAEEALPLLKDAMAEFHVEPEQVLIRAVRFPSGYEVRLQEKQLTYQERDLAQAQRALEDQKAITETKDAEIQAAEKELRGDWDKKLQLVRSDNEVKIAQVLAEADVYDRRTRAEAEASRDTSIANGTLAVEKAEALRNKLRNQALDTTGGRIFLAQQAAENLTFDSITLNSNDPKVPTVLDLDAMVKLLVGSGTDQ